MAENEQNVQTPITINVNGNASNPNDTALNIMLAWINRLNGTLGQIKTIVEDRQNLSVADDIRVVSEDTLKKVRKSVSDAKRTILKKMSEEKGVLTEELDALHKSVEGLEEKLNDQTALIREVLERQKLMQTALEEYNNARRIAEENPVVTEEIPVVPTPVEPTPEPSTETEPTQTNTPENTEETPTEDKNDETPKTNDEEPKTPEQEPVVGMDNPFRVDPIDVSKEDDTTNTQDGDTKKEDDNSSSDDSKENEDGADDEKKTEPTEDPKPIENTPEPAKYKKAKFLAKSMKETAILAEPKRPWYKRLATFAINHPVLTVLAGAGIGLGVVGAMCGVTLAAGIGGMLSQANFFLPSLAIGTGIGAVGGGVLSGVSKLIPAGRRERLYKKFAKQYNKAMSIDRTKDLFAVLEQKHKESRQKAREKDSQKGILKSLGVYKAARSYHKMMSKASRKMKRYFAKKYIPATEKALVTKTKLNEKEVKRGKTMAVAGYLQKRRKLEGKLASGKIEPEEFEEDLQDMEEDVKDLKGGEYGISETNQFTYDKEAMNLIEKVKKEKRSKGMDMMIENIKKRNSKEVPEVVERVYRDPAQIEKEIERLKVENKQKEAKILQKQLDKLAKDRQEFVEFAVDNGEEVDTPVDLTPEEITNLMNSNEDGRDK